MNTESIYRQLEDQKIKKKQLHISILSEINHVHL